MGKKSKPGKRAEFTWLITPRIISEGTEERQEHEELHVPKMKTEVVMMKK